MIALAVTTARRGEDYLPRTLQSLAGARFRRPLVCCDGDAPVPENCERVSRPSKCSHGPWPNFLFALGTLLHDYPTADAYAVTQDDITVARGTCEWLTGQLWPGAAVGVLHLYLPAHVAEAFPGDGWFRLPTKTRTRHADGALFVVMPRGAARLLVRNPPGKGSLTRTDHWLLEFCKAAKLEMYRHRPGLVEHIGAVTSIPRGRIQRDPGLDRFRVGEWVRDVAELPKSSCSLAADSV